MKKIIPLFLLLLVFACNSNAKTKTVITDTIPAAVNDTIKSGIEVQKTQIATDMSNRKITHMIINVPDKKFGYYILIDGQIYIEQKTIPAIEGNAGFVTKADAEKVALKVIEKIKEGELPPSISVEELKEMNISY